MGANNINKLQIPRYTPISTTGVYIVAFKPDSNLPVIIDVSEFLELSEISTLQEVTDVGATTTNPITITGATESLVIGGNIYGYDSAEEQTLSIEPNTGDISITGGISDGNGIIKPYKSYTVNMEQSGIANPIVTILENNLSGAITWVRTIAGNYTGTLTGAFTANKTWFNSHMAIDTVNAEHSANLTRIDINTIKLEIKDGSGAFIDEFIANLEIRVYN